LVGDKIIEQQPKKSSHKTEGKFAAALNVFFTILLHYHDQKIIKKNRQPICTNNSIVWEKIGH
jgi:hypothetical protein